MKLNAGQIKALWLAAGGPQDIAGTMTAIALAESGGETTAINPGRGAGGRRTNEYSVGLWQINTLAHKKYSREQLKDAQINASEAVRIYRIQGFRAWGAYTDGNYRRFLSAAGVSPSELPPTGGSPSAFALGTAGVLILGLAAVLIFDD